MPEHGGGEGNQSAGGSRLVPAERLQRQLEAVFLAWGMPADQVKVVVQVMLAADLAGIDSHGIAMLPLYDELRQAGKLAVAPAVRLVRETPATALLDGGGGLGHVPASRAMALAIAKARSLGVGAVAVRNSNHYGAAGIYAAMAAAEGLIGLSTSAVHNAAIVPLGGTQPMFGTNPFAFAAPARRNEPFLLDMATSTAAIGKLKIAHMAGRPVPQGWAMDPEGRPIEDAAEALRHKRLTPLGATRAMGGHKGSGLAMMVEILSTTLAGAAFAPIRDRRDPAAARYDVGHFCMAVDPGAFRDDGGFQDDLDDMMEALRATPPVDPAEPVQVAGDPEHRARRQRQARGIPVPDMLLAEVERIAGRAGAPFLLAG